MTSICRSRSRYPLLLQGCLTGNCRHIGSATLSRALSSVSFASQEVHEQQQHEQQEYEQLQVDNMKATLTVFILQLVLLEGVAANSRYDIQSIQTLSWLGPPHLTFHQYAHMLVALHISE